MQSRCISLTLFFIHIVNETAQPLTLHLHTIWFVLHGASTMQRCYKEAQFRLASLHLLCISSALPSVHNLYTEGVSGVQSVKEVYLVCNIGADEMHHVTQPALHVHPHTIWLIKSSI